MLYVIFRSTLRANGSLVESSTAAGEVQPIAPNGFEDWLAMRLGDTDRHEVPVMVIREILNTRGMIGQCTIERRRGSVDGSYRGDPARVEFIGAATEIRLYRSDPEGGLTETVPAIDISSPRLCSRELLEGERKALQDHFRPQQIGIIDSREASPNEELVGLSTVAHILTADGREIGCGIGWFGDVPFVLKADFPRCPASLDLSDIDEAAINAALRDNNLVRGAVRRDQKGIAVTARRCGSTELYLLRLTAGAVTIEPYAINRDAAGPEQQRWIRYAETYEGLTVLDVWNAGDSDDVIILTGDVSGQLWRHRIDIDGVEACRREDDDAAIGAV